MAAVAGRIAAWLNSAIHRASNVPWRDISSEAIDRVLLVAKTACAVHVVNSYVCGLALVLGPSMLPTINLAGDVVAVDRISARWGRISVGDVVLLRSPENPRRIVAKRILGMEGDKVSFLVDPGRDDQSKTLEVPKGHIWVQGDNIYDSRDSRQFGPVPFGLVQGRAFYKVWPLEDFGFIGQKL